MSGKRWWYATKTRRQSLVLGLVWSVLAAAQWALVDHDDVTTRRLVPPILLTVLAIAYLTSWAFRRCRPEVEHS